MFKIGDQQQDQPQFVGSSVLLGGGVFNQQFQQSMKESVNQSSKQSNEQMAALKQ